MEHYRDAHATVSREMQARGSSLLRADRAPAARLPACLPACLPQALRSDPIAPHSCLHGSASASNRGTIGQCAAAAQLPSCPLCRSPALQARLAEAQAASTALAAAETEGAELVRRLIEMKDREADRMNEINRLEAETVSASAFLSR